MIIWENKNVRITLGNQWTILYKIAGIQFRASTKDVIHGLTFMIKGDKVYMNLMETNAVLMKKGEISVL